MVAPPPPRKPSHSTTSSSLAKPTPSAISTNEFEWGAIGDSWTSGVAYSAGTVYKYTDFEFCYRTTEAWGAQMEADKSWTKEPQKFHFAGCGGTLLDDIPRQIEKTGNSQLMIGTLGGNNAFFGDIARACIYQPAPGPWGKPYDEDPKGEGECKKALAKSKAFINNPKDGLRDEFRKAIEKVITFKQKPQQLLPRFDLYVSSYVQFFDATTDPCDEWSFGRWFSTAYPKLVKPLRKDMNDMVAAFNKIQGEVIDAYQKKLTSHNYHVHQIPVSDEFKGHRFCEAGHSEADQWTSADVWIWNLQWNNGDTGGTKQPAGAPKGPLPVMSLDTNKRNAQDNELFQGPEGNVTALQSGFGWTARPFHPKPKGHVSMKNFFIERFKKDGIPGVGDVGGLHATSTASPENSATSSSQVKSSTKKPAQTDRPVRPGGGGGPRLDRRANYKIMTG
jgi:hypothetical protein